MAWHKREAASQDEHIQAWGTFRCIRVHSGAFGGIRGHLGTFRGIRVQRDHCTKAGFTPSHTENVSNLFFHSSAFLLLYFLHLKIKRNPGFWNVGTGKRGCWNDDTNVVCLPDMSWSRTVSKGGQKGVNSRKTYKTSPCLVSTRRDGKSGLTFNWRNSSEILKQQLQDLMNLAALVLKWATCM